MSRTSVSANAWEPQILARRVAAYDPKLLDRLCLSGMVGWGRLSPHPATLEESAEAGLPAPCLMTRQAGRRVVPSRVAPITFFVREEADWMISRRLPGEEAPGGLGHAAREVLEFLPRLEAEQIIRREV